MEQNTNNSLIRLEEFNSLMQNAPDTLKRNQLSVSACQKAGQALLDTIEAEGGITDDSLDEEVSAYLAKTKVTVVNMNKRRKPLTQLLSGISKAFTTLESAIDVTSPSTIPHRLQQARNDYARRKMEERKRREEEARKRQMAEQEKGIYRADVEQLLDSAYAAYVERHINALNGMFHHATLATFNDVARRIKETGTNFVWGDFCRGVSDTLTTVYMDDATRQSIKREVSAVKSREFAGRYEFEISGLKQSLLDRLPSLRKQLEEQEELRRTNAEEAARLEEERKRREAEERARQEAERKRKEAEARTKAEAERAAAEVQAAFNFQADVQPSQPSKANVKKRIRVTNPQGYLQVYNLWFTREGINLPMDELDKVHKKMIAFCEKLADKEGELISSGFVRYEDEVKAK